MVISLSLSACWNPEGSLLSRTDLKAGECRIYKAVMLSKTELGFEHKETLTIDACDGQWGVSTKTLGKMLSEYNSWLKQEDAKKE